MDLADEVWVSRDVDESACVKIFFAELPVLHNYSVADLSDHPVYKIFKRIRCGLRIFKTDWVGLRGETDGLTD